ncbi:hypothetical protein BH09VER1_BH09VER1_09840 [soil metagenome]
MLVFALMVLVVGAVILAGWIHVMAGRVLYTEAGIDAMKRRIVLENSRALASQCILQNVVSGSLTAAVSVTLDNGWGGFTFTATNVVPLTTYGSPAWINVFSPGGSGGYSAEIQGTLSDGSNPLGSSDITSDYPWVFKARSRSPMLGFDLYTSQTPPSSFDIHDAANFNVGGNVVLWSSDSPNTYLLRASTYQVPSFTSTTISDLSGGVLLTSNFAFAPITTGVSFTGASSTVNPGGSGATYLSSLLYKAGGPASRSPADPDAVSVYSGTGAMVNTATNSSVNGVTSNGGGGLTIDLSNESLQKVYIVGSLTSITLQGYVSGGFKTADELPAVLVVYAESGASTLSTITLQNPNNRRLYLGVKKATNGVVTIQPSTSGTWRLAGTFENTPITFSVGSGTLLIQGGLRSDQSVLVNSGTVSVTRETNPLSLIERYGDRNVWLETYRND